MASDIIEYSIAVIPEIGERLKKGEVGIFPSDTIYSLSGIVTDSVRYRIFSIKDRAPSKSLIVLMNKAQLKESGYLVPDDLFLRWPAPFTAIVDRSDGTTVAVRVPSDLFLQDLLPLSGPIYSTSVNISGESELRTFDDIKSVFDGKVDFIVNDPTFSPTGSSTLIDATKKPYQIIRQGIYVFSDPEKSVEEANH